MKRKPELTVCPLGGMGEIGKNLTVFRCGDDFIIVDCGLKFPEEDMLGIDFVIPDIEYLIENKSKIRAIFITHGHEDHIGALPFVLPRLDVPVYCSRLAGGLIENKMVDAHTGYTPDYRYVSPGDRVTAGCFEVEFIQLCHSIPDAFALAIHTPLGVVVHTGDFKFDPTPSDGNRPDYSTLARLGDEGVLLLMSDSTNVERPGSTPSEKVIGQTFERFFRLYKDRRIIIATFASNLNRTQMILATAARFNRKAVLVGRSMTANVELAAQLGYLDVPDGLIVSAQDAEHMPDNHVVILTTGSQGEPFSGLVLMSRGAHRQVKLGPKDLVIISATPIPGNEKLVSQTVNRLFACGAEVIYEREEKIHVSGHASRNELMLMFSLTRPKFFVPCHGEYRHLVRHAQLAREMGVAAKNVFILQNGDQLRFADSRKAEVIGRVQAGPVLIDGVVLGEFEGSILRERREMAENGLVVISVVLDGSLRPAAPIQIQTRGSVYSADDGSTFGELENAVRTAVAQFARTPGAKRETLPTEIRKRIREVFSRSSRNYPTIIPLITYI
ncbi:ribonuclease J [Cloacibacillus sp. An23]|uniref:ribonuclease J n=1 Tax=Cloacibacillus sp. An23 TaxID=1965591 RepID=UPI001EF743AA|nr:ribonuclease J [Cloacibacillus sp. An23]